MRHALVNQLSAYKDGLPAKVRSLRTAFQEGEPTEAEQLDFHTAYELLYRFVDDLHNYAQTHASLADHSHAREDSGRSLHAENQLAGLRRFGGSSVVYPDRAQAVIGWRPPGPAAPP